MSSYTSDFLQPESSLYSIYKKLCRTFYPEQAAVYQKMLCPLIVQQTAGISLLIAVSGFIHFHAHLPGLILTEPELFHAVSDAHFKWSINVDMHGVFHVMKDKVTAASDNNAAFLLGKKLDNIFLCLKNCNTVTL